MRLRAGELCRAEVGAMFFMHPASAPWKAGSTGSADVVRVDEVGLVLGWCDFESLIAWPDGRFGWIFHSSLRPIDEER